MTKLLLSKPKSRSKAISSIVKALSTTTGQGSAVSTTDAVRIVLTGKYASVSEAFASDNQMLERIAQEHSDPISRNGGVMAGSLRHR